MAYVEMYEAGVISVVVLGAITILVEEMYPLDILFECNQLSEKKMGGLSGMGYRNVIKNLSMLLLFIIYHHHSIHYRTPSKSG